MKEGDNHGAKNPIMVAWEKATYEEQIAFRNQFVRLQNVILCKLLRIIGKCVLKCGDNNKEA